jgi:hypothetical protein
MKVIEALVLASSLGEDVRGQHSGHQVGPMVIESHCIASRTQPWTIVRHQQLEASESRSAT